MMSLEGPQLRYARADDVQGDEDNTLEKALDLARRLEELLEDTRSVAPGPVGGPASIDEARAHSTRMARAMAAGLVDELENLTKPPRSSRVS